MTFVKDPLNATTPREIIEYSQDLEDRVENGFDSLINPTTTTINTFQNGWEGSLTLSKYGDLVAIKGRFTRIGATDFNTHLATIPSSFRPYYATGIAVTKGNLPEFDTSFILRITSGGNLIFRSGTETLEPNVGGIGFADINQVYSV